jgi:hypothetical protein
MNAKYNELVLVVCLVAHLPVSTTPTHVYVRNCTPLQFDISIDYEEADEHQQQAAKRSPMAITPYATPEEKNMVLSINRFLPQGEHLYTINLIHGTEKIYLKQKLISKSLDNKSELGISLASACLHDPWFMNSQAKERHEHLLTINGLTIVIVYYAYDNKNSEDIEYILYEKSAAPLNISEQIHLCSKSLAYSLAVPASSVMPKKNTLYRLLNIVPALFKNLEQNPSEPHITAQCQDPMPSIKMQRSSISQKNLMHIKKFLTFIRAQEEPTGRTAFTHGPSLPAFQAYEPQGHGMLEYIAQKEDWYSGYSVTDKTHYWIPRNKIAASSC